MDQTWVTDLRDHCIDVKVPFFFKQWGGVVKSRTGRSLDGRTWDEMPDEDPTAVEERFPILATAIG